MNKILARVAVEYAAFLALSDDSVLDPDVAIAQLERLASLLQAMSEEDRAQFLVHVAEIRQEESKDAANADRVQFLSSIEADLGLE